MRRFCHLISSLAVAIALILSCDWCEAASAEQRKQVAALRASIRRAGGLFKQRKFAESAKLVSAAQQEFERLSAEADESLRKALRPAHTSLGKAHALLELEGFALQPLPEIPTAAADEPSFTNDVVPIFVGKCGRCHVRNARGEFRAETYAALMRGSAAGVVILPKDPDGSRLIEVIESGDMPRGGAKVSREELQTLRDWIAAGAKNDGENDNFMLASLSTQNTPQPEPMQVAKSTGRETVSFARDIAPVIVEQCSACHGNNQPRGNLNLRQFASLLRGGASGPVIQPGRPADSLLIQKLRGSAGDRMPLNRPPLPEETIQRFETWVREGATFDGDGANQDVATVAAIYQARNSTHEELAEQRRQLATANWQLAMPGIQHAVSEYENVLVIGDAADEQRIAAFGQLAELQLKKLAKLLRLPSGLPMVKGRATLYLFQRTYDYGEFTQMVEKRQLSSEVQGHWRFSISDAYGAVMIPQDIAIDTSDALLIQQLAGIVLSHMGNDVPYWFADGVARASVARLVPKSELARSWAAQSKQAMRVVSGHTDILEERLAPEHAGAVRMLLARDMMKTRGFAKLMAQLQRSQNFEASLGGAYGANSEDLVKAWLTRTK